MFRGLYIAGSSLTNNNTRLDVISNNVANINTTGFKKDLSLSETFEDVLVSKINGTFANDNFQSPLSVKVEEDNGAYTMTANTGYFRVQMPDGIAYSKSVKVAKSPEGQLKTFIYNTEGKIDTSYGYPLIGQKGAVKVGSGALSVDGKGNLTEGGQSVDQVVMPVQSNIIGSMGSGIKVEHIETDFTQGNIETTGNTLDFALRGNGFFTVETPSGAMFTRNGSFKLNANNELVTNDGYKVLGTEGPIVIKGKAVIVTEKGDVQVDGTSVGALKITAFENQRDLRKAGSGLFKKADGVDVKEKEFTGTVEQGRLEGSNADSVKEMVEMMSLFRNYESGQRLIRTYDETIGRAVNDVARF